MRNNQFRSGASIGDAPAQTSNGWHRCLDSIAQPDCVLPSQFFGRWGSPVEGEIRLLIAVLQDAINTYVRTMHRHGRDNRLAFDEVNAWFQARDQRGLFAFEPLCAILGLDPDSLRRWLRALRGERPPAEAHVSPAGRRLDSSRRRRPLSARRLRDAGAAEYQPRLRWRPAPATAGGQSRR